MQVNAETATVLPPEAFTSVSEIDAPAGLVNIPIRLGQFVGRERAQADLDAGLAGTGGAVIQAVHGLGGVGKSTLAAHYATTHAADFDLVWWIAADSVGAVEAGLADLAVALQPALAGLLPPQALRERALLWLASHRRWLLVLDNVEDPAHIASVLARTTMAGAVLVTTRRTSGWNTLGCAPVRLDVLDESEALALLVGSVGPDGRGLLDGAAELCAELGYLPLAIDQAGAYLATCGITAREYLALLAEYPAVVYDQGADGAGGERTIARIWRATLDQLADDPLPRQVLQILAWYAPSAIPVSLLAGLAEPPRLTHAIGRLAAHSMINVTGDRTISVHRLVQAVARTPDSDDPHRQSDDLNTAYRLAAILLDNAIPKDWPYSGARQAWQALLPHVEAFAEQTPLQGGTVAFARILSRTGRFLDDLGSPIRGIGYLQRSAAVYQRVLGEDHPDTLASRNNLASAYRTAGDLVRAISLYEQTLVDARRVLGEDHPHTLTSQSNLAGAYLSAGNLGLAIPLFEQTLNNRRRILGEDHPDTLTSRHDLAWAHQTAGDLGRAIPLYEQNLTDAVRVLGEDHPNTMAAQSNLASAYQAAGKLDQAVPLIEQTLNDRRRILGQDHPHTLASGSNLAGAYRMAGDLDQAIPLYEQILTDAVRVLGEGHPNTMAYRNNVASSYQATGNLDRAIPLFEQTLNDAVRILGEDHPDTPLFRNNLAGAYEMAGDLDRATPLFEQTLNDRLRILGNDHPDTHTSRYNLAGAYQMAGGLDRAIPLFEQTLNDRLRILGNDHPDTLAARSRLARAYYLSGDLDQAAPLYELAFAEYLRVFGDDHPQTDLFRLEIAAAKWERDQQQGAD